VTTTAVALDLASIARISAIRDRQTPSAILVKRVTPAGRIWLRSRAFFPLLSKGRSFLVEPPGRIWLRSRAFLDPSPPTGRSTPLIIHARRRIGKEARRLPPTMNLRRAGWRGS